MSMLISKLQLKVLNQVINLVRMKVMFFPKFEFCPTGLRLRRSLRRASNKPKWVVRGMKFSSTAIRN
jgi:hypothetical protein